MATQASNLDRGESPFSDVQEAGSAPFWPCPPPADLNTPAAVIGCGAWEARNPRPFWGGHMENSDSVSHREQEQRPQIRPGLTQALRLMGKSLQWGVLDLNTGGPVEPSLQECWVPSQPAGDTRPVSGCFSEITLGVSWHLWVGL